MADSMQRSGGTSSGKPVMCQMFDRDKLVVALYFPSSHPPSLAFYTSLISKHLAFVGQEMEQCFEDFVTWYDYLLLTE